MWANGNFYKKIISMIFKFLKWIIKYLWIWIIERSQPAGDPVYTIYDHRRLGTQQGFKISPIWWHLRRAGPISLWNNRSVLWKGPDEVAHSHSTTPAHLYHMNLYIHEYDLTYTVFQHLHTDITYSLTTYIGNVFIHVLYVCVYVLYVCTKMGMDDLSNLRIQIEEVL